MKKYNSIPYWNKGLFDTNIIAFDKIDGSNIRVEFSKKLSKKSNFTHGFKKFGTRNQLINGKSIFGEAVDIFYDKYAEGLEKIFTDKEEYKRLQTITVFLEFFGKNSFAGTHESTDKKDLILFDVFKYQKGFITPKNFIRDFEHLGIPNIVYEGIYNREFVQNVQNNAYNLREGVVVKGVKKNKGKEDVWMVKIKTNEWLTKVKNKFGVNALIKEVNNNNEIIKDIK